MSTLDPLHFHADTPRYDWLVVTASNENQAANYRQQLAWRKPDDDSGCDLPGFRRVLVVSDPHGKRAGSGGSTFAVIAELARAMINDRPRARTLEELLGDQHVLILHSGGDARRLPPYAPQGKIFIPVPGVSEDGRPLTLFDRVLGDFYSLPRPARGRLIIGAGDLLLHLDFDRPLLDGPGVVGVAAVSPPDRGTRHGVYVTTPQGDVTSFLQKPTLESMAAARAISPEGTIQVDTGVLSIDWNCIAGWMDALGLKIENDKLHSMGLLAEILAARAGSIDLYEHVLCLLAPEGLAPSLLPSTANAIKGAISGTPFRAACLKRSTFFHLGTSRELVEFGTQLNWGASFAINENNVAILSSTLDSSRVFTHAYVENCDVHCRIRLDGFNVMVNVPAEATRPLRLDHASCAVWFPIDDDKWTLIRYPLDFDWKTSDIAAILWLMTGPPPLATIAMKNRQLLVQAISPQRGELTAFHARLWTVGTMKELESLASRLRNQDWRIQDTAGNDWLNADRISLAELPMRANLSRIHEAHSRNTRHWFSHHADQTLRACPHFPTARILEICGQYPDLRQHWVRGIDSFTAPSAPDHPPPPPVSPGTAVRLARLSSVLEFDSLDAPWTPQLRLALSRCAPSPTAISTRQPFRACTVSLPARIDLAGGWTDTPPICTDSGGLVINLAVNLSGRSPIRASVKPIQAQAVVIKSLDQNQQVTLPLSDPLTLTDTSDWSALARAALSLTFVPIDSPPKPLGHHLSSGLEIAIESAVPKGSGLGTSSILAAALVSALRHSCGHTEPGSETTQIARRVSAIEQIIGSCGGWQDQYGGLISGLKSLQTWPGMDQTPQITRYSLNSRIGELLGKRTLLYYTGQQRLAANILQKFLNRYLDRDAKILRIIRGIQKTATDLQTSIVRDDPEAFIAHCTRYWQLKSQVDPSATNAAIQSIINVTSPDLSGYLLPGAGGGGFLLFFANSVEAKQSIINRLTTNPPNKEAKFYDLEIDESGPQITIES